MQVLYDACIVKGMEIYRMPPNTCPRQWRWVPVLSRSILPSRARRLDLTARSRWSHEFKAMVEAIRVAEKALGTVHYGVSEAEAKSRVFRRSLFVVKDMKAGETFTNDNVRSIRPGYGLHTRYLDEVLGRRAARDIERGTPLTWDLVTECITLS